MKNRIVETFDRLKREHRKGLVGYLTAGDPDATASRKHCIEAIASGIDVLELGVPFSDPTADGPSIQEAARRALAAGMTLTGVLDMVRELRREVQTPIVLFGYANPLLSYGYERICIDAAAAGADGMLVVDMPAEEAGEFKPCAEKHGLIFVPLVAPSTPPERAREILKDAQGFVYYIMVMGVTGARDSVAADVGRQVEALRRSTTLPIAAGFGIGNGKQAREAAEHADAVVVGSALVNAAHKGTLGALVREIRASLDN